MTFHGDWDVSIPQLVDTRDSSRYRTRAELRQGRDRARNVPIIKGDIPVLSASKMGTFLFIARLGVRADVDDGHAGGFGGFDARRRVLERHTQLRLDAQPS